jgi:integrase/recombinase XerD
MGGRAPARGAPDAAVQDFLDYLRYERGMSSNTLAAYGRDLAACAAFLAARGVAPERAAEDDLHAYFDAAGGDGAASSVARRTASLRAFYAHLVREGVRDDDPAARLRSPRRPQDLPRVLSVEAVGALLAKVVSPGPLGQRDLAALELLYGCGLRVGELVGLREGDVDPEGGLVRCTGKGDKERVVPMGQAASRAVALYVQDGRRTLLRGRRRPELFLNARGGALTRQGVDYLLRKVLARAGMLGKASAHTFRHSFATHLLAAGADLRSVQEMLGHANVATTQLYTHVTVEHLREVFLETHPRARRRAGGPPDAEGDPATAAGAGPEGDPGSADGPSDGAAGEPGAEGAPGGSAGPGADDASGGAAREES